MGNEVEHRAIALGIVGPGLVGKALIAQLAEEVRPFVTLLIQRVRKRPLRWVELMILGPNRYVMQADRLLEEWGLDIQVHGITDSKWMLLSYDKIDLNAWQSALDKQVRGVHEAQEPGINVMLLLGNLNHQDDRIMGNRNGYNRATGDRGKPGLIHIPLCKHPGPC